VLGADGNWDDAAATWKSRDGVVGWSGGQVDAAARRARLTAFLATPQPAPVAERAQAELAKLK
jgi:hypothetical protein